MSVIYTFLQIRLRKAEGYVKMFLVTGGAGFIGSNIVCKLITDDEKVRLQNDFSTGKGKT